MADAEPKKKRRKWWIVLIVIIVLIIIILVACNSGDSDSGSNSSPKKVSENSDSDGGEDESEGDSQFVVGDTIEIDDFRIDYLDCGEYTDYDKWDKPEKGNKVMYAKFEFENISKSTEYVSFTDFYCYADGYECERYYGDDDIDGNLSSGKKTNGGVYFEVPEDAEEIIIEYEPNFLLSDRIEFVVQ